MNPSPQTWYIPLLHTQSKQTAVCQQRKTCLYEYLLALSVHMFRSPPHLSELHLLAARCKLVDSKYKLVYSACKLVDSSKHKACTHTSYRPSLLFLYTVACLSLGQEIGIRIAIVIGIRTGKYCARRQRRVGR